MKRFLLIACVGFAAGFIASGCGTSTPAPRCTATNCEGCCDASDVCHTGDQGPACGAGGVACNVCSGGQVCVARSCTFEIVDGGADAGTDAGADAGPADGGGDGGSDAGTGDAGTPRCAATAVTCSDTVSSSLDLKVTVNAAAITDVIDGTGFKSTIDTTAGGIAPTMSYVYAKFTDTGLQKVNLSDEAALLSLNWDIAFRRFVIRLNGGSSGPSCVDAAATSGATGYDALVAVPAGLAFVVDDFVGPPTADGGCVFKDDGSGLTSSPSTALATFYAYTSCVSMTNKVFVVRTRLGRDVKLTVTTYYATEAAQTNCNNGLAPGAVGGTVRVRWSFLD